MKRNVKIIIIFLFLILPLSITAQQPGFVKFDVMASKIESVYHVKLYYNSEWFGNQLFKESLVDSPLEECFAIIKRSTKLNIIKIKSECYIFVPLEIRNYSYNTNRDGVLLIGDVGNLGEIKKQQFQEKYQMYTLVCL